MSECKTICLNESGMKKLGRKKPVTNEKLVQNMMRESQVGVVKQAFIIEAIRAYSEHALTILEDEWGKNHFIGLEAWQQCARECVEAINNRG